MAGSARLRTLGRGVLLLWLAASVGESLAATCCELFATGRPTAPVHGADGREAHRHGTEGTEHAPALRHAAHGPLHRTEQHRCPAPELRDAAAIPAKAAELPRPRLAQAPPPHGAGRVLLPGSTCTGAVQPRAPPPTDPLRLIPRLRI